MRLREAGVPEGTIADLLWHSTQTMTRHYSVAQVVELPGALPQGAKQHSPLCWWNLVGVVG